MPQRGPLHQHALWIYYISSLHDANAAALSLSFAQTRKDQIAEKAERRVDEDALAAAYHEEMKRKV